MSKPKTIPAAHIEDALRAGLPSLQRRGEHLGYQYHLPTKFGTLLISPCDGAIRTRFEEVPPAAPCGASLNPYSGKWNFEGLDDDSLVRRAIYWIERIAVQPSRSMAMAIKVHDRLPDNCALRRGTLIVGVPKRDDADPMQPAIDQIERALRAKHDAVMAELQTDTAPPSSESTTRKPNETK